MFNRVLLNVKQRSGATLRSWSYQCESIFAQRSRRFQQLFSFYHQVYGTNGLRRIFRAYHKQLQPPLKSLVLGAVALCFSETNSNGGGGNGGSSSFDWKRERLSLTNFDGCLRDIDFINSLSSNKLCDQCKMKQMRYCYCLVGNKNCDAVEVEHTNNVETDSMGMPTVSAGTDGIQVIKTTEENNWEPYFSTNDFSIWRREERTSMYSYKVYAKFNDVTASELLHVQTDLAYRKQWDETAVALELIENDPQPGSNSQLIYWEMQWPKLFANRDYVYCRRFVTDHTHKVMMICNRGTTHPKYPDNASKVRVTDYWSLMVIKPFRHFEEPGVHYILTYYDDPGLPIPQNIKSWVTQKQMPEFLMKMYNATKQYSYSHALEMKLLHRYDKLNMNEEYSPNAARWLSRLWNTRERGE